MDWLVGMMQEDAQAPRTRNRDVRAARTACATTAEAPGTQGRLLRVSPPPPLDLLAEVVREFLLLIETRLVRSSDAM